ncbi:hypothetical protein [Aeromicrobium sp. CTD01-1L150]|uniref:hypothetical protein n=1 Tax=Aeromicrobium sp. CTD01-1L150 TaxID=3341830 RepID=UPI0035C0CAE1
MSQQFPEPETSRAERVENEPEERSTDESLVDALADDERLPFDDEPVEQLDDERAVTTFEEDP